MSNATVIQQTAFLQAQQSSSVEEYIVHPDFRIVAAFFLGWVFLSSLAHIIRSNFIRDYTDPTNLQILRNLRSRIGSNPSSHRMDFAQFCSLLAFSSTGGRTGCTFVVAWGGMASQAGRLAGLLLLSFELQRRGIKNLERCTLWSGMFIALVFVFAFNATNTGTLDFVPQLGISICDRQHVLSTSVSRSISFLLLELYVAGRLISLTLSRPCRLSNFTAVLVSHDAAKAESLIIVDILALIPIAVHGSVLSQFIPVSVGSLLVLAVFNYRTLPSIQNLDGKISTTSVCVVSTQSRSPNADVRISRTRESSGRNSDAIVKNHEHRTQALVGDHYNLGIHLSSLPYSAPARIGWRFLPEESAPGSHQILPLQAQYAERFDQPVIQVGPVVKPLRDRPQVQVVIEAEESIRGSRTIPSSIIGSDIIRPPSRKTRKDTKAWSPASIAPSTYLTYSAHDSYLTTRSAYRDSSHSTRTASSHALSAASDDTRSRRSGRDLQRSRSGQSPKESSLKAPWGANTEFLPYRLERGSCLLLSRDHRTYWTIHPHYSVSTPEERLSVDPR
ncbi:hypothetical protein A0H81_10026 [Grifola frondosa]|uniref:Uncharacterized protein n=1 Tax=Grifola frondosa TaxID=5627 RepID=A0A1C7M0H2_GRIFR|nr:hypothetical protein A0H81_10026 [Grifola frondosa]